MAFVLDDEIGGTIKVIVRKDSALAAVTKDQYDRYLDTLDETVLGLLPDATPSRFILRLALPWKHAQKIKSMQLKMQMSPQMIRTAQSGKAAEDDEPEMDVGVDLSYLDEETRLALCGIQNPTDSKGIEFKLDGDGGCDKALAAKLQAVGILDNLYAARTRAMKRIGRPIEAVQKN